ncbi:MAG: penicillin-insensitive murein endopeptidase [Polyangia bacterium]|jgi:penicillin-insensitive murein endopeptidase
MFWLATLLFLSAASPAPDGGTPDASAAQSATRGLDLRWSHATTPQPGPPRAIGQPGAGCLQGAVALPLRGPGWMVMHPERHREFGHPALLAYLRDLASRARREHLGLLGVGDLGQPRGGPMPTGHRSHQIGLDADVWYGPPAKPPHAGQSPAPPALVDLRTGKLLPAWNTRVARLIETAASDAAVDRIFVHPAIKRALCQDKGRAGPWLQRVRPWWAHHDHFHVRLRCPTDSADCKEPQPLPAGQGCDASLDWWFSDDARATAAKRGPPGEGAPPMPEQCEAILHR